MRSSQTSTSQSQPENPPEQLLGKLTKQKRKPMTLGSHVSSHPGKGLPSPIWYALFTSILIVMLLTLGIGLSRAYYGYTNFGIVAATTWSRSWFFGAVGLAVLLVVMIIYRLRLQRRSIALHRNGLRLQLSPRINQTILWTELRGISTQIVLRHFWGLPFSIQHKLTLYTQNNQTIQIHRRWEAIPKLIDGIQKYYYPYKTEILNKDFSEGKWVQFGPLSIHRDALKFHDRQVPWDTVEHITVRSGILMVELTSVDSLQLPAHKIPNLELFLRLIKAGVTA